MGYLRAENVGKAYKRYENKWGRLIEWLSCRKSQRHEKLWVLRDISFEIASGESVGIIGQNGAGKSTLLKLITGTSVPTVGTVSVGGRISALLELGMGFHPEFTGRQNVYMAGQLMGFSAQEMTSNMDAIESFAEIGSYIDQPVRTYSSGMQVRLAFSVATAARPEILVVDEALSVGDIYFQQKCFERIKEFKRQGTTLLFVSHDLGTVYNLCDRAMLIDAGQLVLDGSPKAVIDLYEARLLRKLDTAPSRLTISLPKGPEDHDATAASSSASRQQELHTELTPASIDETFSATGTVETPLVKVLGVTFLSAEGTPIGAVVSDTDVTLMLTIAFSQDFGDPHIGFKIRNRLGVVIFETNTYCMGRSLGAVRSGDAVTARFKFRACLGEGEYTVTAGVANEGFLSGSFRETLAYAHEVGVLRVVRNPDAIRWAGITNLAPELSIERRSDV
jgi:lipopolysaccharide transport system ATP-binding protein